MRLIIYGDFNCPFSYLASQRADELARLGLAEPEWRAVEHDRRLPLTGSRSEADREAWDEELAQVAALASGDEHAPAAPPPLVSNTGAAVAAYAEAVADAVEDELRRRLFRAIWVEGRHISSAYEVRRLVTDVIWPTADLRDRLASPDIPGRLHRETDLARVTRRSGGTIAPDGGPLTTAGYQRIRRWRAAWLSLPDQTIPAVAGPDGAVRPGIEGLRWLGSLLTTPAARPATPSPANAGTTAA